MQAADTQTYKEQQVKHAHSLSLIFNKTVALFSFVG